MFLIYDAPMVRFNPQPNLTVDSRTARRYLLAHHHLLAPRKLVGKAGILEYFRRVACIQYDTINVVGRNADLVLQSRVKNYRPDLLESLLYEDRALIDGWDKLASIYATSDWPYFARRRAALTNRLRQKTGKSAEAENLVLARITEEGPLSSLAFEHDADGAVGWAWGPTKLARAALETLFATGDVSIRNKVGTRRVFDLTPRLLPLELLSALDPNSTLEDYQDWHVTRRVGSMGIATLRSVEYWYGLHATRAVDLQRTASRLLEQGHLTAIRVEGVNEYPLVARTVDLEHMQSARLPSKPRAALIAPLDNLIWNRRLISELFQFNYIWEVYKPPAKREYGYYVLPVLYGDRFVARMDSKLDRKENCWTIKGWWWEDTVSPDAKLLDAIGDCLRQFANYLGATTTRIDFSGPTAATLNRLI